MNTNRRRLLAGVFLSGTGFLIQACTGKGKSLIEKGTPSETDDERKKKGKEVSAVEDLMREHGVLRRALIVYTEAASRLRGNPSSVPADALQKTAKLFRAFGEEYHEKKLEEAYIFPAVKQAGGAAADYPDILAAQHRRGREITNYILAKTQGLKIKTNNAEPLALALESLVRMYRSHAAREDTVVFPAWKQVLSIEQLDEMGEKFEDIEHRQFGEDGFENAVRQISDIENAFGMTDIAQYTSAPPPAR